MNIIFDKSLKSDFIRSQKLARDASGYLVNDETKVRIKDNAGKLIKAKQFGGVRKGSVIYLSEDIDTIIKEASLNKAS